MGRLAAAEYKYIRPLDGENNESEENWRNGSPDVRPDSRSLRMQTVKCEKDQRAPDNAKYDCKGGGGPNRGRRNIPGQISGRDNRGNFKKIHQCGDKMTRHFSEVDFAHERAGPEIFQRGAGRPENVNLMTSGDDRHASTFGFPTDWRLSSCLPAMFW